MKKLEKVFLCIIMILFCFTLPACGNKNNDNKASTKLEIIGATKKNIDGVGEVYYLKVPNNQIVFNFSDYVKTSLLSNWTLSKDIEGNQVINSKTIELNVGDNPLYYIYTKDTHGNQQTYIVLVRRRTTFNVYFNSNGGSSCSSVNVEEDGYLENPPIPTKTGYSFDGWDFDFKRNPITKSFTANAKWASNRYTITYDPNGGAMTSTSQYVYYGTSYSLYVPEKTGYLFDGWKINGNYEISSNGTWNKNYDVKLTASWTARNYSINYNLNGGNSNTALKTSYTINDTFKLPDNITRTGYSFDGWAKNNSATTGQFNYTISIGTYGNLTFYAIWKPNKYIVTYDVNGGNALDKITQEVIYGKNTTLKTVERIGYTFMGWYNNTSLVSNGNWNIDRNVTLKAEWEVSVYTITYNNVNALNKDIKVTFDYNYSGKSDDVVTLSNGQTLSYPTVPTREDYIFAGWYTNSSCTSQYSFSGSITEDMTLYAKWVSTSYNAVSPKSTNEVYLSSNSTYYSFVALESGNVTISIGKNGFLKCTTTSTNSYSSLVIHCTKGSIYNFYTQSYYNYTSSSYTGYTTLTLSSNLPSSTAKAVCSSISGFEYSSTKNYVQKVEYNSNYELINFTRTGYKFNGWYNGSHKFEGGIWKLLNNVTLTPSWEIEVYTITYDVDGGKPLDSNTQEVTYGQNVTLKIPEREGYTFNGWYEGTTRILNGIWNKTDDVLLKAKWTLNTYRINYVLNGATSNSSNPTSYTYESETITLVDPAKTGYIFLGWTNESILTPTKNVQIAHNSIEDKNFTANWEASKYTITYDVDGGTALDSNTQEVTYGNNVILKTTEREGYTFNGWYNGSTKVVNGNWYIPSDVELKAKWTVNTYRVTFNNVKEIKSIVKVTLNYNYSGSTNTVIELENGQSLDYPTIPTRENYIFAGWYSNLSCTHQYLFRGNITEDITLYAKWAGPLLTNTAAVVTSGSSYTINCNTSVKYYAIVPLVGGTISVFTTGNLDTMGYLYTITNSGSISQLTYSDDEGNGNNFEYSYDVVAGKLYYIGVKTYSSYGNARLYIDGVSELPTSTAEAVIEFDSTFEYSETDTYVTNITFGDDFEVVNIERTGLVFGGWYHESTKVVSGKWSIASDVVLTPVWGEGEYKLTLDPNGGTVSQTEFMIKYGENYELPTPTKTGYEFKGWYNGSVKYESGIWNDAIDIELKAHWEIQSFTITYNLDGGINNANNPTSYSYGNSAITLQDPSKTGYTFKGWTGEGITTPTKNIQIPQNSNTNKSYTANWEIIKYTITYNTNGGINNLNNPAIYFYNDETITLQDPSKSGYTFKGWTGEGVTTPTKNIQIIHNSTGNKTYTANWEVITYSITYKLSGGTSNNPTSYNYDTETFTLAQPVRLGFTFAGWTGTGLTEKTMVVTISKGSSGNKEFIANWIVNNVTATYDKDGYREIKNINDLVDYASNIDNYTVNARLYSDLDLGGAEWIPIGKALNGMNGQILDPYKAIFDGNGFTIHNFKITDCELYDGYGLTGVGFFGVTQDATIKNLNLQGFTISINKPDLEIVYETGVVESGTIIVGGLVGIAIKTTIEECYETGEILFNAPLAYIGGLVGYASLVTVKNCYADVSIYCDVSSDISVGGLIGTSIQSSVENSYATGNIGVEVNITSESKDVGGLLMNQIAYIGGLIGLDSGFSNSIKNCYATGSISGKFTSINSIDYMKVGGLIGATNSTLSNCYRFSGQEITVEGLENNNICEEGTSADMQTIWSYISSNWDDNIWNLYSDKNPTLKVVSEDGFVKISTKEQLIEYASNIKNYSINARLYADINLGGMEWTPIGTVINPYKAVFDGNGFEISNYKIISSEEKLLKYIGFFGFSNNAIFKNLGLSNYEIICEFEDSTLEYSVSVGGLVGKNTYSLNIENCYTNGSIKVDSKSSIKSSICASGLVGSIYQYVSLVNINNSYSLGSIDVNVNTINNNNTGIIYIGGIIASAGFVNEGLMIDSCYSSVDILVNLDSIYDILNLIGGLIGSTDNSIITNSYATGNIDINIESSNGPNSSIGGLIGSIENSTIENCYTTVNIKTNIENSTSININAGGIVGCIFESVVIINCYAIGDINTVGTNNVYAGGLISKSFDATLVNCYRYDEQIVIATKGEYSGNICEEGTNADMETIWTFVSSNWDSEIWNLYTDKNPTLK